MSHPRREPAYVIKALHARPMVEWAMGVAWPIGFSSLMLMMTGWSIVSVFGVFFFAYSLVAFLFSLFRGRIELTDESLTLRAWPGSLLAATRAIPLTAIVKVAVAGSVVRIGYEIDGEPKHTKLILLAPVAEELFDQLQARVERHPELCDHIDERSDRRFLIRIPTG